MLTLMLEDGMATIGWDTTLMRDTNKVDGLDTNAFGGPLALEPNLPPSFTKGLNASMGSTKSSSPNPIEDCSPHHNCTWFYLHGWLHPMLH